MQFKGAKREHHSLTAVAEKLLLIRMAKKIPQPINSDHLTGLGFIGLAASGYMGWTVMLVFLLTYFLLCIEIYLATYTLGRFHLSFGWMGPTELRIILIVGNMTAFFRPNVHLFGGDFRLFDVGGAAAAIGITAITIYSAIKHTRELYQQEPLVALRSTAQDGSATRVPQDHAKVTV